MSLYQTDASAFWRARRACRISLLAIGLASLLSPAVSAGTLVEFPNLDGHTPANLSGYLARPDAGLSAELGGHSDGAPYPAVVVLHGCNGMFGSSAVIADRLSSWGYVTLAVDSLGPRVSGIANRCDKGLPEQAFDAYAALRYLSQLDFVDPARVAVLGQSLGAETALHAVIDHNSAAQSFDGRFRAAIAYYPYCDASMATVAAPSLILVGEADERNPVEQCREMAARARRDGAPVTLIVYPGVHHNFDVGLLTPGARYKGFWMEYNEPAAKDAEAKTRAFLDAHLAETPPGEPSKK
jgi:dienelactone hydrolase